jgi:hypothetical protein
MPSVSSPQYRRSAVKDLRARGNTQPSFVGSDHYCDTAVPDGQAPDFGVFYSGDRLFDGIGGSSCGPTEDPLWFERTNLYFRRQKVTWTPLDCHIGMGPSDVENRIRPTHMNEVDPCSEYSALRPV